MSTLELERALQELKAGAEDIRPSDVVMFSEPLRSVLSSAVRRGQISLTELAEQLEFTREQTSQVADILVARNLFRLSPRSTDEEPYYETRMSSMTRPLTRPPSDIWKKLDD